MFVRIVTLITVVLLTGCVTIDGGRVARSADGAVNTVINGTIEAAADTTECGVQAKISSAIMRGVAKNSHIRDYAVGGDYARCVDQKRRIREEEVRRQQWALERAQEEARRMAERCRYQVRQTARGGIAGPKEESRECSGERYESFIKQMILK